ncbi:acyl-CoA dehydrogenase family protein [Streptomyces spongiae]|uniref:Acyl-CoA dehydrogenase n=1 Tax=Streptomyces spongiae TaxID=565072 RepID=A0A5N8XAP8_9ACTN|nr:acyl-CoA dehydrogenase family protein [Streptomyces spongiae]MPY56539.1 acyl-CoA dehydrogenase [Streptomyces spongiae]
MTIPAPTLSTAEETLGRIHDVLPVIAEHTAAAERERTLQPAAVRAMVEAGMARLLVPQSHGGLGHDLTTWFDATRLIGQVDASHAWCASLMAGQAHDICRFAPEAQQEVWRDHPDALIAAAHAPGCRATPVPGGYRLSGRSPWMSGIGHATWATFTAMLPGDDGQTPVRTLFLLPADDFTIEQTWDMVAMRGTGSNTGITDDVFVPHHRVLPMTDLLEGVTEGSLQYTAEHYRSPYVTYAPAAFLGPMLGAALGALRAFRERATAPGSRVAGFENVQYRIARAAADLDTAELLCRHSLTIVESGGPFDLESRARCARDYARAAQLIVDAVDSLMKMSGSSGFAESQPIQKVWRDIHLAASHVALNTEHSFVHWGRLRLGLERLAWHGFY